MHLQEAAQYKKKFQMKKNAIDGMMNQMADTNIYWGSEAPQIPKTMRGIGKTKMSFNDQELKGQNLKISNSLRKDLIVGGARMNNEHSTGRFANTGMWGTTNKSTKNTDRNMPMKVLTNSTYDNYDKKLSMASPFSPHEF